MQNELVESPTMLDGTFDPVHGGFPPTYLKEYVRYENVVAGRSEDPVSVLLQSSGIALAVVDGVIDLPRDSRSVEFLEDVIDRKRTEMIVLARVLC